MRGTILPPEQTPPTRWLLCPDCASTASTMYNDDTSVMVVFLDHSASCPAWKHDEAEVVLAFGPDEQTIKRTIAEVTP